MRTGGVAPDGLRGEPLPARAGIGLRSPHVAEVLATRPALAWLEVHPENYLGGGPAVRALHAVREQYPLSFHAVGLSVGSAAGVDRRHLGRIKSLVDRFEPALVSEHLAWSQVGGAYLNHLLPLPYTEDSLAAVSRNVDEVQTTLGRRVLIENPSGYLRFTTSTIPEAEFLAELARRTGCGLLLDVNNVYVSAQNLGLDSVAYMAALPPARVGELHLAGHSVNDADGRALLIDDHGSPVTPAVWALYEYALRRFGAVPTLVEWDTDIPSLEILLAEAQRADARLLDVPGDANAA
jgi:uncharacterized protein (UPF0276 family)